MKSKISLTSVLFGLGIAFGAVQSANAIEGSIYKFNKEMQVTITTVTGNYFRSYEGLVNKPLAQLVKVQPQQSLKKRKSHDSNNFFELAMQMQDKVHYYIAVVDELFEDAEQKDANTCETSRFAKFVNLF